MTDIDDDEEEPGAPEVSEKLLRPLGLGGGNPWLWSLKYTVEDERFIRIFDDLAKLIGNSERACEQAAKEGPEEYAEFIADIETEYLEEMVGAAFLILQSKIRRVTKAAIDLSREMMETYQIALPALADDRSVKTLCGSYKSTERSLIEFVWAFGNYFKHRDEWAFEVWEPDAKGQSATTRLAVEIAGVVQFSTGNMRRGFEFLDVEPYSSCGKLAAAVQDWARAVYAAANSGLEAAVRREGERRGA